MSEAHLDLDTLSRRWLDKAAGELPPLEKQALGHAARRRPVSRDINRAYDDKASLGERLADRVAAFGGSWTFIGLFGVFLAIWTGLNLVLGRGAFDPYPFIFLNLMLSMVAALQAPVIMMSQNRQSAKDRLDAANDYQVNLKAEIEIMGLHDKLETIRNEQLQAIIERQNEQLELMRRMLDERTAR